MKNAKLVAWGILISIGLSVVTGVADLSEDFYTFAGLGFFVFGTWASVLLIKNAPKD
jgi:hypothetical protein